MPADTSEVVSLVDAKKPASNLNLQKWVILASVGLAALFFFSIGGSSPDNQEIHQSIHPATGGKATSPKGSTPQGSNRKFESANEALKRFKTARESVCAKLREDYGEYFEKIFFDKNLSRGRILFESGDGKSTVSYERSKRKLTIKVLQALSTTNTQFIWATGGHSSTAGHGNFYDESYTAYMERAVKPVFQAVSMEFTGRNYAMGGTAAGPEVALCVKEIFGQDIDVLSWDFGMTDGGETTWRMLLYNHRAALNRGRPINLAYHAGGSRESGRLDAAMEMERVGMASMLSSEQVMKDALDAVPESFGLTEDQIQALPLLVRNFKCDKNIEKGDPYCGKEKFNETMCGARRYKTSWHQGWKWHALMGNLAALFLFEVLEDAIKEVEASPDPATLLSELQAQEDADYALYKSSAAQKQFRDVFPESEVGGIDFDVLVKGHNYCHTGRLPAEIRHKGILTESSLTGFFTYDKGIHINDAKKSANTGESMRLAFDDLRQECPVPVNVDYKDFFYLGETEGWKSMVVPNDAELKEYGNGETLKGFVAICLKSCDWGQCEAGELREKDLLDGKFEMNVNGVSVLNMTKFHDCHLLKQSNGYVFPVSSEGRFDIRAKVTEKAEAGSFLRFSSFIVW